jgi:Arc/MetJ family transcription regulator
MATAAARVQVPLDADLSAAVAELGAGKSKARTVHDLALRGAEVIRDEQEGRQEAIAHLLRIARGEDNRYDFSISEQLHAER